MMKNKLFATLALAMLATPAFAFEQTDLSVGLKTLPMLTNKLSGSAVAAVVYDPANADSKAEADVIKGLIDANPDAPGGVKLTSLLVGVADLAKLSGAKLAFVTKGLSSKFDAVSAAAASAGVLTISTDIDCVKGNKCVLGISSKPTVEIFFSKAAADAGKIGFSQAFTMLAKQV